MAYSSAPTHGKTARSEKNDVAINFTTEWGLDFQVDLAEKSRQGQDWKEYLAGMAGATGTISGQLVLGNTEQKALADNIVTATPGSELSDLKFLIDGSSEGYSGTFILNSFANTTTIGDVVTFMASVTLTGAPTLSDAQ